MASKTTKGSEDTVDNAITKRFSVGAKYISLILLSLGLVVSMVIWATSSHAEIKSWTAGQDYVTKQELKQTMKDQYVPLHQFTEVKQSLKDQKEDLEKIEKKLDRILLRLPNRR